MANVTAVIKLTSKLLQLQAGGGPEMITIPGMLLTATQTQFLHSNGLT